jgi:hypothetical protein
VYSVSVSVRILYVFFTITIKKQNWLSEAEKDFVGTEVNPKPCGYISLRCRADRSHL